MLRSASDPQPLVRRSVICSSTSRASPLARRISLAVAALALVACRPDALTEPALLAAPSGGPQLTLVGGACGGRRVALLGTVAHADRGAARPHGRRERWELPT